jgi:nucleotide-binding universal stress UspA family protein
MIDEILLCLDGSSMAEKIMPIAQGIAAAQAATLTVFKVMQHPGEVAGQENYLRDAAQRFGAQIRFSVSDDPAQAIIEELDKSPGTMAAMTTHGRTAWGEAILGSVAFRVLRGAKRPIVLYCPLDSPAEASRKITTLVIALDGSEFAEQIIPFAAEMAKSLAAELNLLQVLPLKSPVPPFPEQKKSDLLESSYLHRQARAVKKTFGLDAQWDVLHGEAADAICNYIARMPDTMLAMTTHGRGALQRAVLGSVAGECIRHAARPLLLYWPRH